MIYLIKCQDKLKVGWTEQDFEIYLAWLQRRIPFRLEVIATRDGYEEEEREFHRAHKEDRAEYGGNEWYDSSDSFLAEAKEFLGDLTCD